MDPCGNQDGDDDQKHRPRLKNPAGYRGHDDRPLHLKDIDFRTRRQRVPPSDGI
jgi:hypothetical protein